MFDMSSADPREQRLGRLTSISKPSFSHCKAVNGKESRPDTCSSEQHHQTFRHASSSARIVGTLPATRTRAHQETDFELLTAVRVRVLLVKPLSRPDRVPHHADANRDLPCPHLRCVVQNSGSVQTIWCAHPHFANGVAEQASSREPDSIALPFDRARLKLCSNLLANCPGSRPGRFHLPISGAVYKEESRDPCKVATVIQDTLRSNYVRITTPSRTL